MHKTVYKENKTTFLQANIVKNFNSKDRTGCRDVPEEMGLLTPHSP